MFSYPSHFLVLPSLFVLFTAFSSSSNADWYAEASATNFTYQMAFADTKEDYEINPTRIRAGYSSKSGYGLELQLLSSGNDQIIDFNDNPFEATLDTSWGLFASLISDYEKYGFYGNLGFLSLSTTYTDINRGTSDTDDFLAYGLNFGGYYSLTKQLKLSLDYNTFDGDTVYLQSTNPQSVDIDLKGLALGLRYHF